MMPICIGEGETYPACRFKRQALAGNILTDAPRNSVSQLSEHPLAQAGLHTG